MELRRQIAGRPKAPWTVEELKAGLLEFYKINGHYPTATEVDSFEFLPSARTIERSHGGIVQLRKLLKLGDEHDYRTGTHSTKRARTINSRAHEKEKLVYDYLTNQFGSEFVHREFFFTDDHRTRADFFVYDTTGGFCVDVFYPSTRRNLAGCLNIKLLKYSGVMYVRSYPVIFLQMNSELSQEELDDVIKNKSKKLQPEQRLMAWDSFQDFCNTRNKLKVSKE